MNDTGRVILFLKSLQAGKVKTRLAARLGADGALDVYTAMVVDLLTKLQPLRDLLVPFIDALPKSTASVSPIPSLLSQGKLKLQQGGDLGERMSNAFREVFSGGAERAILIGSDIPGIDSVLLEGYLERLRSFPMVIGPAADGGYYLVGFQRERFEESIFNGIDWSTERVLEQTLAVARSAGLHCHLGEELQDVDTIENLESLVSPGLSPGSLAVLLERYLVRLS